MMLKDPPTLAKRDRASAVSALAALSFCLAGCEAWLDIPDAPRWIADAAVPLNEPTPPVGSPAGAGSEPALPGIGAVVTSVEPSAPDSPSMSDPPDRPPPTDPVDAGSALPAPAPVDPAPAADRAPADPPPADPVPAADPPPAAPPPVYPDPPPEDPDPPANEPPPQGCRAAESTGPDGRCYLAVAQRLSWGDARRNCRDRGEGWDLSAIRSNAINRFIGEMIGDEAWFGASDAANEGEWIWVDDGTPFWSGSGATGRALNRAYENWNSDEPNGGVNTNCTRLVTIASGAPNGSPAWADLECEELRPSICAGPER